MREDNTFMKAFDAECEHLVERDTKAIADMIQGRGKVEVSTEQQLKAYRAMTEQDLKDMEAQKGTEETLAYIGAMMKLESRRKQHG